MGLFFQFFERGRIVKKNVKVLLPSAGFYRRTVDTSVRRIIMDLNQGEHRAG